jgi:hypothetical protein
LRPFAGATIAVGAFLLVFVILAFELTQFFFAFSDFATAILVSFGLTGCCEVYCLARNAHRRSHYVKRSFCETSLERQTGAEQKKRGYTARRKGHWNSFPERHSPHFLYRR